VRDGEETNELSVDRYNLMRAKQQNVQPAPSVLLNSVDTAPVAPEIVAPPPINPKFNSPFFPAPATTAPSVR
jgi:general secretion pathway protein D